MACYKAISGLSVKVEVLALRKVIEESQPK